LRIEAAGFPQVQVNTCQTAWCHNLQDHDVNIEVKDSYLLTSTCCGVSFVPARLSDSGEQQVNCSFIPKRLNWVPNYNQFPSCSALCVECVLLFNCYSKECGLFGLNVKAVNCNDLICVTM
jgi:hypothetical protein